MDSNQSQREDLAWVSTLDWDDVCRILEKGAFAGVSTSFKGYFQRAAAEIRECASRLKRTNHQKGPPRPWSRRRALLGLACSFGQHKRWKGDVPVLADAFARICQMLAENEKVGRVRGRRQGATRFAERDYVDRAIGELAPNCDLEWLFARGIGNKLSAGRQCIRDRALELAHRDRVERKLDPVKLTKEIRERAKMPDAGRGRWYWNARLIPNRL